MQAGQTPTFALQFHDEGPPVPMDWNGFEERRGRGMWIHLDRRATRAREWAEGCAELDPAIAEALFEEDTRPRFARFDDGELLILRAVNLNPGADPEDMVSLRIWVEPDRVITVSGLAIRALEDTRQRFATANGPIDPGAIVATLAGRIAERSRHVVQEIDDGLDDIEEALLGEGTPDLQERLLTLRRRTIWLRRFLAPQTAAITELVEAEPAWLTDTSLTRLGESMNTFQRMTEALDAVRDHAALIQDQLGNLADERTSRTVYHLTIITAVFLPVNLIAALLGANVAGIPGSDAPTGFLILCAVVGVLIAVEIGVLRLIRWI